MGLGPQTGCLACAEACQTVASLRRPSPFWTPVTWVLTDVLLHFVSLSCQCLLAGPLQFRCLT